MAETSLNNIWEQHLLQPNHILPINPQRLQFNFNEERWHLREEDKPDENIFSEGFTIPDFILNADNKLVIVEVSSSWKNFRHAGYSFCMNENVQIPAGVELVDQNNHFNIVSSDPDDRGINLLRGSTKAEFNLPKLVGALTQPMEVKAFSLVGVFDYQTRHVIELLWNEVILRGS